MGKYDHLRVGSSDLDSSEELGPPPPLPWVTQESQQSSSSSVSSEAESTVVPPLPQATHAESVVMPSSLPNVEGAADSEHGSVEEARPAALLVAGEPMEQPSSLPRSGGAPSTTVEEEQKSLPSETRGSHEERMASRPLGTRSTRTLTSSSDSPSEHQGSTRPTGPEPALPPSPPSSSTPPGRPLPSLASMAGGSAATHPLPAPPHPAMRLVKQSHPGGQHPPPPPSCLSPADEAMHSAAYHAPSTRTPPPPLPLSPPPPLSTPSPTVPLRKEKTSTGCCGRFWPFGKSKKKPREETPPPPLGVGKWVKVQGAPTPAPVSTTAAREPGVRSPDAALTEAESSEEMAISKGSSSTAIRLRRENQPDAGELAGGAGGDPVAASVVNGDATPDAGGVEASHAPRETDGTTEEDAAPVADGLPTPSQEEALGSDAPVQAEVSMEDGAGISAATVAPQGTGEAEEDRRPPRGVDGASSRSSSDSSRTSRAAVKAVEEACEPYGRPGLAGGGWNEGGAPVLSPTDPASWGGRPSTRSSTTSHSSLSDRWNGPQRPPSADARMEPIDEAEALLPAYQRRILLELRSREHREQEDLARQWRELRFQPQINRSPRCILSYSLPFGERLSRSRGSSPVTEALGVQAKPGQRSFAPSSDSGAWKRLWTPRKTVSPPPPPTFRPTITPYGAQVDESDPVFDRLFHGRPKARRTAFREAAPTHSFQPVITERARRRERGDVVERLYRPSPQARRETHGRPRTPAPHPDVSSTAAVFERLYRARSSPRPTRSIEPRSLNVEEWWSERHAGLPCSEPPRERQGRGSHWHTPFYPSSESVESVERRGGDEEVPAHLRVLL